MSKNFKIKNRDTGVISEILNNKIVKQYKEYGVLGDENVRYEIIEEMENIDLKHLSGLKEFRSLEV